MATLLAAAGCRQQPPASEPEPAPELAEPAPRDGPPSLPIPMPPLDREKLLIAALRAASASTAGLDDRERQSELAGERFVFRFRFGCAGPADKGPRRWSYDANGGVLRVHFEPAAIAPEDEGKSEPLARYVVEQPWLLRAACPVGPAPAAGEPADGRVTLAQRYTDEESRAARLPELFRLVERTAEDSVPREGLDFVLSGKLEEGENGRVITCNPLPAGGRPDCVIAVSIETARLQDPASGRELASWGDR